MQHIVFETIHYAHPFEGVLYSFGDRDGKLSEYTVELVDGRT